MIIAVGFKVNSVSGSIKIAKDYTIKGLAMDDERLKRGTYLTEKYFDEQLERIREIHANVRKFYQKITDPYAKAIAYDEKRKCFYVGERGEKHDGTKQAVIRKIAQEE